MQFNNHSHAYGWIAILIHWSMAIALIGLAILGLWMVDLGYYSPWYQIAPFWHKSIGLLLIPLLLFRLYWRFRQPIPQPLKSHSRFEQRLARQTHRALYVLLAVILASGYLISTAKGEAISLFGWFEIPALISGLEQQADLAGQFHYWSAISVLTLAALHALGAFKHHIYDRDSTLVRMINPTISTHEDQ